MFMFLKCCKVDIQFQLGLDIFITMITKNFVSHRGSPYTPIKTKIKMKIMKIIIKEGFCVALMSVKRNTTLGLPQSNQGKTNTRYKHFIMITRARSLYLIQFKAKIIAVTFSIFIFHKTLTYKPCTKSRTVVLIMITILIQVQGPIRVKEQALLF